MLDHSLPVSQLLECIAAALPCQATAVAELLAHQSDDVRDAAADALVEMDDAMAAQAVAKLAGSVSVEVRAQVPRILAQLDKFASDHLDVVACLLQDPDASVRVAALEATQELHEDSLSDKVVHLLSDTNSDVRAASACALASFGQDNADHAASVAKLLSDPDTVVRGSAVDSLAEMGEQSAAHASALACLAQDEDWMLRGSVAKALGRLGRAAQPYQTMLADLLADQSVYVSRHAAQSLGRLASGVARKDLEREIQVETLWKRLLDEVPPQPVVSQVGNHEVWLCEGLLSKTECARVIGAAEGHGFGATTFDKAYRGNLRLTTTDTSLAAALWGRLQKIVPARLTLSGQDWEACGVNDRWRLSKYNPQDLFGKHVDACFLRTYDEISMFTINIYLNDGFAGGSTRFYFAEEDSDTADLSVKPQTGLCLLFRQPHGQSYLHDGEKVGSGLKYLLRSDVMYRRVQQ